MRVLVGPLVAVALTAAGCGNSSTDPQTKLDAPAAQAQAPGSRQFQEFANCLRDHGVDLPQRGQGGPPGKGSPPPRSGGGPPGFNPQDANVRKAFRACRDKLPQGAGPGGGPPRRRRSTSPGQPSADHRTTATLHANLGITSIYLQGIDNAEIIHTV